MFNGLSGITQLSDALRCSVRCGNLIAEDRHAVRMALDDLRVYWEKAFGAGSFLLADEQPEREADLDLLIGTAANLPLIAALEKDGRIEPVEIPEQGFALDIFEKDGKRTAVLRAADRLGLQYAVYGFAEQFLGVRFVHPLLDLQPEKPPMPKELHVQESPSVPLRILFDTSHVRIGGWGTEWKASHFSDSLAWRWEDWAGNPVKLLSFIAWGVKNRANNIVFDDTTGNGAKAPWVRQKPFMVSQAIWDCLDARGLKTMMWCGPGYTWGAPEDAYRKEDYCNHTAHRSPPWDQSLCIGKPAFWEEADAWLDVQAEHRHRLSGIFSNWQENTCGEGVTEGHEDGVIHNCAMSQYDMNSARLRKSVLSKGGGCTSCGHLENVEKWNKHLDYLKTATAARGLPPAGFQRTFWGIADPDDGIVAERVVPHLPPGSVTSVSCLPACHRPERIEAWPRLVDDANAADGGDRRIIVHHELIYSCGSDVPVVPFTNLDRVDDHFRVLGKYRSFAGFLGGTFVYHSMGWLLTLYAQRKQWQRELDWKSWITTYFAGLLGREFADTLLDTMLTLKDVEVIEGLEPGEEPGGYYVRWGLNLHRFAPEALPADGPLRADDQAGPKFPRLVHAGSADADGIYTSLRCAPALKRILSMREKIERALDGIAQLARSLPAGVDGPQWNELVILPLRVTARFLQARLLLAQSYVTYVRLREGVLAGRDTAADAVEGLALCRGALDAQDEYIRLRPGFCFCYPEAFNPTTLRNLAGWWTRLAREPGLCRDLDICAFLDRVETEVGT